MNYLEKLLTVHVCVNAMFIIFCFVRDVFQMRRFAVSLEHENERKTLIHNCEVERSVTEKYRRALKETTDILMNERMKNIKPEENRK